MPRDAPAAHPYLVVRRCTEADLSALEDAALPPALLAETRAAAAQLCACNAWCGTVEGTPVVAAGITAHWPGYGTAWMRSRAVPRRLWPAILRATRAGLDLAHDGGTVLIELVTRADDPGAMRWAARCGFVAACRRPHWMPDGGDAVLWQRVRAAPLATSSGEKIIVPAAPAAPGGSAASLKAEAGDR